MSSRTPRDFQLAELVAEKVLGWQRMPSRRTWRRPFPENGSYLVRNCSLWGLVTDEGRILRAAVEALRTHGGTLEIVPQADGKTLVFWTSMEFVEHAVFGSTLARALALVALRIVGCDVDDDQGGCR